MHFVPVNGAPSVSYIVPARNEAGTIQRIVDELPRFGVSTEIIFIENGSHDHTLQEIQRIAKRAVDGVTVRYASIVCKGKVEAVLYGFGMAQHDICIIYDADMTVPSEDIVEFYKVAQEGRGVLVNGSRLVKDMQQGAMRPLNYVGNVMFPFWLGKVLGVHLTDTLCGTKVLWKCDYEQLIFVRKKYYELDPFGDFDLLIGAAQIGLRIIEIPVQYRARVYGKTNIRRIRNGGSLIVLLLILTIDMLFVRLQRGLSLGYTTRI